MRSSPLWDVTQRGLVATDVLRKVMDTWPLKMGPHRLFRNAGYRTTNQRSLTSQKINDVINTVTEAWSQAKSGYIE